MTPEKQGEHSHEAPRKEKRFKLDRATLLRAGVIAVILLFVAETFVVLMYQPTTPPQTPSPSPAPAKTFTGAGQSTAKIISFTPDLFVLCNASSQADADAAALAFGNAFNQPPALALSETAGGTLYYVKLSNASQATPQALDELERQLAPHCNGLATTMRQAIVSFTNQITLADSKNASETATLSAYALRAGAKAFVTEKEAVEGDEIPVRVEARIVQGQVTQFIAFQVGSLEDAKPVETKSGLITATLSRWLDKGRATIEVPWANRTSFNENAAKKLIESLNYSTNATQSFRQVNEVIVSGFNASKALTQALKNLSFVENAEAKEESTIITVKQDFASEEKARDEITRVLDSFNASNYSIYFNPSKLYINFQWNAGNSSFNEASKEIDDLFPGANFRRTGLMTPTNESIASKELGFQITPTFEAYLYPSEKINSTLVVYVQALVQGKRVLAFYAEG
jgi:hypothetical protein